MTQAQLPPVKIAFINNQSAVVDVLHTEERLASILLSNPLFIDLSGKENVDQIEVGWEYDVETGNLSIPAPSDSPTVENPVTQDEPTEE